jgi:hypothetical protein
MELGRPFGHRDETLTPRENQRGEFLTGYLRRSLHIIEPLIDARIVESSAGEQHKESHATLPEVMVPKPEQLQSKSSEVLTTKAATPEQKTIKPETVMEKVAKAAEVDSPIERLFELSHEVKDEQSSSPAHIGTLLPALPTQATKQERKQLAKATAKAYRQQETGYQKTYRQAIKMGFWAAVTILTVASLLVIIAVRT